MDMRWIMLVACAAGLLSACEKAASPPSDGREGDASAGTAGAETDVYAGETLPDGGAAAPSMIAVEATDRGELTIEPINHSALRFAFGGRQYYVDPAGEADWGSMPGADAILITHAHRDHLDTAIIDRLSGEATELVINAASAEKLPRGRVIRPGETIPLLEITVEAVPAYNVDSERRRYHPRERADNGYVLTFGGTRVYVAGDTGPTAEMKALRNIDIAFLPINLPYTMPPAQAAEAARRFRPAILYPYHQGGSDPAELKSLLADEPDIEVRVLPLP